MLFLLNYILASLYINSETVEELIINIRFGSPELIVHVNDALDAFYRVKTIVALENYEELFQTPYMSTKNMEYFNAAVTIMESLKEEVSNSLVDKSKQKNLVMQISDRLRSFESQESLDAILGMVDEIFKNNLKSRN